ncbi:MAG: hypothetical protein ACRCTP_04440 [Aeromonas popoffii]|uniref:hypothetical protein n=1 Tax=Aeromonas popoffii TaxID=70856 RepID=UPI003F2E7BF9
MSSIFSTKIHGKGFSKIPAQPCIVNLKEFAQPIFFEVRGTNGSGKSVLGFMCQELDPLARAYSFKTTDSKNKPFSIDLIGCPSYKTLFVGAYPRGRAVGGVDVINGSEKIEAALKYALEVATAEGYSRVFFEGIMTSTSNSRWSKYLLESLQVPSERVYVAWCNTPLDVCIERVRARSGGDFNESLVEGKADQLTRQPANHQAEFPDVTRLVYDCMCSKEQMVKNWVEMKFFEIV